MTISYRLTPPAAMRCLWLAALCVPLLGGCLPAIDTEETRFYILGTLPPTTPALEGAPSNPTLVVALTAISVPQYLERPQIVTRVERNRLLVSDFDKWGGSLEKNILRSLASNLSLLLGTPDVHMAAGRRPPGGLDARVEVEVMQFERGPEGRALLSAQWRLLGDERDSAPLVSRISSFESAPVAGGMEATVAAMTDLLSELSAEIATAIVKRVDD